MTGGRICPAPLCGEFIPLDRYACRTHWYKLPLELRKEITRTWGMRRGQPHNEDFIAAHEDAKAKADQWLAARYG